MKQCRFAEIVEPSGTMNDETGAFEDVAKANMRVRTDSTVNTLTLSDRILMREVRLMIPEFRLQTFLSQDFTNPPFTPPKLV